MENSVWWEQKGVGNTIDCSRRAENLKRAEKPTETLATQANCLTTIWGGGTDLVHNLWPPKYKYVTHMKLIKYVTHMLHLSHALQKKSLFYNLSSHNAAH